MNGRRAPVLWVDVSDLVDYLMRHNRPSGIQRVAFEICAALRRRDDGAGRVGFVVREGEPRDLMTLDWNELENAFGAITKASVPKRNLRKARGNGTSGAEDARFQDILADALRLQGRALLELCKFPTVLGDWVLGAFRGTVGARKVHTLHGRSRLRRAGTGGKFKSEMLESVAMPGDCLVVFGSPWFHDDYVKTVRWVRDDLRMRFALLMHDLVPVRRPEWCDRGVITTFAAWHQSVLPLVDQIFANSRFTANDVTSWMQTSGLELPNAVRPVPIGTGLPPQSGDSAAVASQLPAPGSYVLFVSTLEARKNHMLLFRVWRRLLADLPRDRVPTLVFAGNVGWLVSDLMQQLENADWLGGAIQLISQASDEELGTLYRGCMFTLFPSLHEGWGLPVSESLALGQPCLASNSTSLPESGGDFARYFDPENFEDAYRAVRAVLDDPAGLEEWRLRVRRDFRPVQWTDSATAIWEAIDALDAAPA